MIKLLKGFDPRPAGLCGVSPADPSTAGGFAASAEPVDLQCTSNGRQSDGVSIQMAHGAPTNGFGSISLLPEGLWEASLQHTNAEVVIWCHVHPSQYW